MFSSQSTLNSVGRNAGISTSSNYWYTGDNYPYIKLYPNGSTINTTEIDTTNNILYLGGSFSRLYQHNVNYHSIYDVSSSSFKIKSKNYGTNGSIYAYGLDTSNNILYVGGNFTSVTDNNDITIDASYVAAWSINTQRWTSLGRSKRNGLNGQCNAIAVDISNQEVYVGGNFTKVSDASQIDQSANYVAKWKVSTERWTPLGASDVSYNNGLKSMCRSLAYDSKNTQLYVGGDFTQVRDTRSVDITTNRIAKWDVSNSLWVGMGNISSNGTNYVSATSGRIFASVYDSCKNYVYVSGDFTYVYDSTNIALSANYIAYWDITNQKWGRLGTASSNGLSGSVYTTFQASTYGSRFSGLAIDSSKQILYVSNLMTSVNDASGTLSNVKFIAAWNINTQRWYRLGGSTTTNNGTSSICGSLAYDSRNNRLHVGGQFGSVYDTSNGTQTVSNIASWDISNNCWLPLGSGLGSSVFSMAMDVSNNYLWVTGAFSQGTDSSGVKTLNSSAYWNFNNSRWYPLGTTAYNGYAFYTNQTSSSILDASNSMFYVTIANSIQAGGTTVPFYDATSTSGLTAYNIAAYNISTSTWQLLGNSTYNGIAGGTMRSIPMFALDTSNSILYLSGNFTSVRDPTNTSQSVNYIAGWNIRTQTWSRLGTSTSNGITNNDNTESNGGAPMAMSVDSSCNLYVGSVGTNVYDASGTLSVNGVASWNSSTQRWRRLGTIASNGLDGSCNAMVLDSSNNRLYVGGNFKKANDTLNTDLSVNCVAYWDITNSLWKTLGGTTRTTNGLDGSCNALAFDSSNNRLYVGGNFRKVHDTSKIDQSANYVAYWDVSNSLWRQIGGYDASKNGVDASVNALAFDSCKNILYVGGNFIKSYDSSFTLRSSLSTEYLASWNPTTQLWSRVGYSSTSTANIYGLSNYCRALIYHPSKSSVYVGGDHTSICDFSNISMDVSNIAYINLNTGNIFPLGSTSRNGTNDKVNSIKLDTINNILYVDGSFTRVVDVSANYIAKYDVSNQSWSRLGSSTSNGLSGMGKALFYDKTNNAVYASGVFTSVRDSSTNDSSKNYNCVAKWDVAKSLWSPLGTHGNGTNGYILAYAYDTANYRVFCGGSFTQVYDNTNTKIYANNVAMYDMNTNTWSAFGSNTDPSNNGINDICRTLVYDQSNTQLYVGGDFTQVRDGRGQDTSANKIAIWKPSESKWYGMGTLGNNGFNTNANRCSVYDSCKNVVYFTGEFSKVYDSSNISGLSVNNIVKWDIATSSFSRLGNENYNGFNSRGDGLAMDTSNQILYVCGLFTTVYDSINTSLNANYIAAWNANTSSWSRLGSSSQNGITSTSPYPSAVLYDSSNSRLYLGGLFTAVSDESGAGLNASYVVYWDILTSRWNRFGSGTGTTDQGVNGRVYDFALDTYNNQLYITGYFTTLQHTSGNISANYIAIWNILTSTWSILGLSNQNGINTTSSGEKDSQLIYDGSNNRVYVCGEFTSVSDSTQSNLSTNRVAYWDIASSKWYRLGDANGNGVGATAKRMALDTSNNYLYVGGNFTTVSSSSSQKDISANYVARWNILTNTWTQLGGTTKITNGVGNAIRTIDLDMSKNLYLGGEFTKVSKTAGDISANYGVIWKPSTNDWSLLGGNGIFNGVTDGSCIALALDPSNQRLYVGGSFTKVRDISNALLSANRIAYWNLNTSTWTGIGTTDASKNGIDGSCNAIVFDSSYTRVYVGGAFRKVSDSVKIDQSVNNVAYWDVSNSIWGKLGASDDSSNNGVRDIVRTLAYDNKNAQLYVGGDFIYARDGRSRDISINRVAIWKPSTKLWSGMGSIYSNGTNGYIYGQVFDSSNNVLYVGGTFTEVYDTSNISLSVNYIATWNIGTKTWSRLVDSSANGTNQVVNCIVLNRTKLHVGGGFTEVYDKTNNPLTNTRNMATWDLTTNTWSRMGGSTWETNGISNAPSSMVIDISNQVLYVACKTSGSNFNIYDSTGSKSVGTIARFNLNSLQWAYLGNSSLNGVGGYYGKVLTNSTAALTFDSSSSSVYCVSYANDAFYYVRDDRGIDISINSVARWDVRLEKWFGLGGHSSNGTNGQINAYAYDGSRNRMYVGGGFTKVYDLSQIWLDVSNVAAWDVAGKYWVRLGSSGARNGVDASVNALAIDSSYSRLYVGGNFKKMSDSSIVDQSANYVVYWDISNSLWGQMGGSTTTTNGLDGSCNALAIDNSNGRVYVGGNFRKVSDSTTVDQSANYVAYWNISTNTWSRLGATDVSYNNGLNRECRSLVYDPSKTQLYVGGDFTAVRDSRNSDILANRIAIWKPTTSQWSVMGSTANNGLDNSCNAMALDSSKNRLYIGGNFRYANDSSNTNLATNYVAYWDISNSVWKTLGGTTSETNGLNGFCNSLLLGSSNNRLYVGGNFKKVSDSSKSDQSANYVVYWDTSNSLWGQIGGFTSTTNGIDGSVNALAFDSNLNLFVGGNFVNASSTPGDISANKAIIWSTSTNKWINLGVSLPQNGINDGSVNALALDEYNQRLYVGGSFSRVKDSSNILLKSNKVAYWDLNNSFWNALGTTDPSKNGVNFTCRTLNYNSNDTTLYAGGDFTRASDSTGYDFSSNYIAVWKPSTSIWYPLGSFHRNANNGVNNSVYTISIPQNNKIFVGGTFTGGYDISGSITSNYGLIWNPSSYKWSKLGGYSKMLNDGTINTLLLDNSFTKLFIGGNFTRMTDNSGNGYNLNDAAIWNINEQSLSSMGSFYLNGLNFYPNVFEMDTNNNVLYMGGNFTYAYNESNSYSSLFSLYVIGYDFTNNKWIQLGNEVLNGVNGEVTGLSIDTTNSILYVSGNYTRVFDNSNVSQSANYIAAYNINTKTWGSLGSSTYNGTNSAVNSILFNSSHSKLYAGGNFTSVYDSSNATLTVKYMAAWNITNSTWSRIGANATYNGVDASINILQYNSSSKYLLTVGNFSNINDSATTKIRQVSTYATYKF